MSGDRIRTRYADLAHPEAFVQKDSRQTTIGEEFRIVGTLVDQEMLSGTESTRLRETRFQ